MQIIIISLGFFLWYFAYEAKPMNNDEATSLWQKDNYLKRTKLLNILKESF